MIPDLINLPGAPWQVLPAGIWEATLKEVEQRFAYNDHRRFLFNGICRVCDSLAAAGVGYILLDGSYVTAKPLPSDFDGCWYPTEAVNKKKLDPVLLDFSNKRKAQKEKYGGELFIATDGAGNGLFFEDFFQIEPMSAKAKGIIKINLHELPRANIGESR
ncbi:DUF6932 family protein [Terasakiella sp.]|uniref:DUF6932 family protein n=1 Tax=Terasakiella sp. TaxID=2034861 RepID=UPI003AA90127